MDRSEMREIVGQEANQAGLTARDDGLIRIVLENARQLLDIGIAADKFTSGDAIFEFCAALEDAIGKLGKAAQEEGDI
jgi:hypothetical protein